MACSGTFSAANNATAKHSHRGNCTGADSRGAPHHLLKRSRRDTSGSSACAHPLARERRESIALIGGEGEERNGLGTSLLRRVPMPVATVLASGLDELLDSRSV
jgi:hypothetical protein